MPTFSFDEVNKVITVELPDTEITVQQLINAIRDWEDELVNMDVAKIADASGKESLGGGLVVGITLNLLNDWQLKFADRPGPDFIQCTVKDGNLVGGIGGNPIKESAYTQVKLILSAAGTIAETGVSGLTEEESNQLMALPTEPELAATHGLGSWEGATPTQVWNHTDRRLTSRDIDSPVPGEHLPSEEQVQAAQAALDAIKGLGFETTEDALKVIRQLVQAAGRRGASFKV
jgi:hypothetical protein